MAHRICINIRSALFDVSLECLSYIYLLYFDGYQMQVFIVWCLFCEVTARFGWARSAIKSFAKATEHEVRKEDARTSWSPKALHKIYELIEKIIPTTTALFFIFLSFFANCCYIINYEFWSLINLQIFNSNLTNFWLPTDIHKYEVLEIRQKLVRFVLKICKIRLIFLFSSRYEIYLYFAVSPG